MYVSSPSTWQAEGGDVVQIQLRKNLFQNTPPPPKKNHGGYIQFNAIKLRTLLIYFNNKGSLKNRFNN